MTTAAIASPTRLRPWRLTVDRYLRMIDAGILTEKDRVYLWKGQLVAKMTKGRPHTVAVLRLTDALKRVVPHGWYVEPEQPLLLDDASLPEPDLKIVRGRMEDYTLPPSARDVPLVIEVADSSLADDRGEALESYAAVAIPIYWIVNIADRQIEVYFNPALTVDAVRYTERAEYHAGDEVPVVLDGRELGQVAVTDVFPSP